jgi:hypothetical protein
MEFSRLFPWDLDGQPSGRADPNGPLMDHTDGAPDRPLVPVRRPLGALLAPFGASMALPPLTRR